MKKKRDYQNQLRLGVLAKLLLLLAVVCGIASAYVYVRNLHIQKSDFVRTAESKKTNLKAEIQMYELRIAALLDRPALESRLEENGSDLRSIERASLEVVTASDSTGTDVIVLH